MYWYCTDESNVGFGSWGLKGGGGKKLKVSFCIGMLEYRKFGFKQILQKP
jgi:hypothetical protein